jgi:hypothetical protein
MLALRKCNLFSFDKRLYICFPQFKQALYFYRGGRGLKFLRPCLGGLKFLRPFLGRLKFLRPCLGRLKFLRSCLGGA